MMKNNIQLSLLTTVLLLLLQACVSTSPAGNRQLRSHAFERKLRNDSVELLDVRTPEEYKAGHLPNARLIDFNAGALPQALPTLDSTKTYLIYCRSAKRSDKAATQMKAAGFTKVYQLRGGILSWKGQLQQ